MSSVPIAIIVFGEGEQLGTWYSGSECNAVSELSNSKGIGSPNLSRSCGPPPSPVPETGCLKLRNSYYVIKNYSLLECGWFGHQKCCSSGSFRLPGISWWLTWSCPPLPPDTSPHAPHHSTRRGYISWWPPCTLLENFDPQEKYGQIGVVLFVHMELLATE